MVLRRWLLAAALLLPAVSASLGKVLCPTGVGCQQSQEGQNGPTWQDGSDDDGSSVTKQPPTRSQDFQKCASAALPSVVNLAPISSGWFSRSGKWADKNGAEHADWEQNRFRIDYNNLDYYVDLKPWFKARVLINADLELRHMRIMLPEPHKKDRALTTVVYMDCVGVPMYVSREFKNLEFEIFNYLGQLVATAAESEMAPGQIYFKDEKGMAFAIAGSPTIAQVATGHQEYIPQWHLYDFDHWQVWFMEGFLSRSYLKDAENRWLIAAIVQEHAILNTQEDPYLPGGTSTPPQYMLFIGLIVAISLGAISCCLMAFRSVFFMVYPPKKVVKGNPFLVEEIGGGCQPYGSL